MDWYAHSIEQEEETPIEKNKVKGVIDEITSSIGNILEENFSGIIRDVEEINRLFRRSTLFKSMSRENEQLKNLVETLKKENDKLKRKAQELQLGMTNVIGAPKSGVSLNILEINKVGEEAKTEVIKELENMKTARENTKMSTSPTPYENYETSSEEDEAVDADNLKKITVADYWKKTQETSKPTIINNLKYKYNVELNEKQLEHLEEEKNYGPHNVEGIKWVTFDLMLKESIKNFLQYSPQHSEMDEELIVKDIIISSAGIKGWGEASLSSSEEEDAKELNNINNHCMNLTMNEEKKQEIVVLKEQEDEEEDDEEDEEDDDEEEDDEDDDEDEDEDEDDEEEEVDEEEDEDDEEDDEEVEEEDDEEVEEEDDEEEEEVDEEVEEEVDEEVEEEEEKLPVKEISKMLSSVKKQEEEEEDEDEDEDEEEEEEEDEDEEELELNEEDIEMELKYINKNGLQIAKTKNKKFYVTCYTDEDGNVYKIEEDEEVGDILGEIKNGIFFVV